MLTTTHAEGATHWPALTKWTNAYLTDKLKDVGTSCLPILRNRLQLKKTLTPRAPAEVTVDFSADGYSDAIRDNRYFVTPESRKMGFSRFLALLLDRNSKGRFPKRARFIITFSTNWLRSPSLHHLLSCMQEYLVRTFLFSHLFLTCDLT
jgi:hypothetical protein